MTTLEQRSSFGRLHQIFSSHPSPLLGKVRRKPVKRVLRLVLAARETGDEPFGEGGVVTVSIEAGEVAVDGRGGMKSRREEGSVSARKGGEKNA
jgi:hypothetical protein